MVFPDFSSLFKIPWLFPDWKMPSHFSRFSRFSSPSGNPVTPFKRFRARRGTTKIFYVMIHVSRSNSPGVCWCELVVLTVMSRTYTLLIPLVVGTTTSWLACPFRPWEHGQTHSFCRFLPNLVNVISWRYRWCHPYERTCVAGGGACMAGGHVW